MVDLMLLMLDASPEGVRVAGIRNLAMLLEDQKVPLLQMIRKCVLMGLHMITSVC